MCTPIPEGSPEKELLDPPTGRIINLLGALSPTIFSRLTIILIERVLKSKELYRRPLIPSGGLPLKGEV
jgi:hypothetical protein